MNNNRIAITLRDNELVTLIAGKRRIYVRVGDQLDALIAELRNVQNAVSGGR